MSTSVDHDPAYRRLRAELAAQGLFEPDPRGYLLHLAWVIPAYVTGWWLLLKVQDMPLRVLLAMLEAFVIMQAASLGHEAGHAAISRRAWVNGLVGRLCMSFGSGSSQASWHAMHSEHHRHANTRRDPNLQARLFSFTEEDARGSRGLRRWCTRRQAWLFWPLITLMGLAFRLNSLKHMLGHPRETRGDQVLVALHHLLWLALPVWLIGWGPALANYLLVLWGCGIYLAAIFVANHLGHPHPTKGRDFMARQAGNARNLGDGWFMRHFFIGLNSHIEHHLFPRIPCTRLHLARPAVRRHCAALDIPYHEVGLAAAIGELHRHNRRMASVADDEPVGMLVLEKE